MAMSDEAAVLGAATTVHRSPLSQAASKVVKIVGMNFAETGSIPKHGVWPLIVGTVAVLHGRDHRVRPHQQHLHQASKSKTEDCITGRFG